jgi:hypothetical protein
MSGLHVCELEYLNGVLDAKFDIDCRQITEEEDAIIELSRKKTIPKPVQNGQRNAKRE